jgi:serine/threonine protein kinase
MSEPITRLDDLVRSYREASRQGRPPDPVELCRDCPELLDDLLAQLDALPDSRGAGEPTTPGVAGLPDGPREQAEPVPGYRLVRRIGSGGVGEVWEALAPGGFRVAFKFVPLHGDAGRIEERSLDVIRRLRHPNLLTLFGAWRLDGWLAVGMELADRTLLDVLEEERKGGRVGVPLRPLFRYALETARALDFLNKPRHFLGGPRPVGIQHGDVKPQNILLLGDGVKVGDFGLLALLERAFGRHAGGLTVPYAAPEAHDGRVSHWSDQYALAVTWCELRGGRRPFEGDRDTVIDGHKNRPPDLSMLPAAERPAVARALSKRPQDRWPSCRAFLRALAEARQAAPAPGGAPSLSEAGTDLIPGLTEHGFRFRGVAGQGAFGGTVFAEGPGGVAVVVKGLPDTPAGRESVARLQRLTHPHVLTVYASWSERGRLFVATERADEGLGQRARREGRPGLPPADLARWLGQAAEGLDFLHAHDVLHRDVKPDNLLLKDGRVLVGDVLPPPPEAEEHGSQSGVMTGTPAYLAPEAWQGLAAPASDQYALACCYVELRTGRRLFAGTSLPAVAIAHLQGVPDLAGLTDDERRVVARALAKRPDERFPNCRAFTAALERAVAAPAPPAAAAAAPARRAAPQPPPPPQPSQGWSDRPRPFRPPSPAVNLLPLFVGVLLLAHGLIMVLRGEAGWPLGAVGLGVLVAWAVALLRRRRRDPLRDRFGPGRLGEVYRAEALPEAGRAREVAPLRLPAPESAGEASVEEEAALGAGVVPPSDEPLEDSVAAELLAGPAPEPAEARLAGHGEAVWAAAVAPGGRLAATGGLDGAVRLWNVQTWQPVRSWQAHAEGVAALAFAPDGAALASAGLDGAVRRFAVPSGEEQASFVGHAGRVLAAAWSPDGRTVLSGGEDGTLRLWDAATGHERRRGRGHDGWVYGVAFLPDGQTAVSAGADGTLRLWSVATGEEVGRLSGHEGPVRCVAVSRGGRLLASGGEDHSVRLWGVERRREVRRLDGHTDWVRCLAFTPDGRLLSGGDDEALCLWGLSNGELLRRFETPEASVLSVAVTPDGRHILVGGEDRSARVWAAPEGEG